MRTLTGNWRDDHVFVLAQSPAMYDSIVQRIIECDAEIQALLTPLGCHEVTLTGPAKRSGKNTPGFDLRTALACWAVFDLTRINGAIASAQALLLSVGEPSVLDEACRTAQEKGLGHYAESDYVQLHVSLIERLPAVLRVYVGCGSILYGDLDDIDLIKIHIRSGKLSLMKFDDFDGKPITLMTERVKIRLRDQDIDFFVYGSSYESRCLPASLCCIGIRQLT